jgi:YbbR domain-containing protein
MKKLLFENAGMKLSAILIALFLWLFVTASGQSEISLKIPIEFKNIPGGFGIMKSSAQLVDITIRGQERIMKNINPSEVRVIVELNKMKNGKGTYYLNKNNLKLPYAVSIMSIRPSALKVELEEIKKKSVIVKPTITGIPEKGFSVSNIVVEPMQVNIVGLKSEIEKIDELRTEAMDITGLQETAAEILNIDMANANVKPDESTVTVKVIVTKGEE